MMSGVCRLASKGMGVGRGDDAWVTHSFTVLSEMQGIGCIAYQSIAAEDLGLKQEVCLHNSNRGFGINCWHKHIKKP